MNSATTNRLWLVPAAIALAFVFGGSDAAIAKSMSPTQAQFVACRDAARADGLSGTALSQSIDACMEKNGAMTAKSTTAEGRIEPTYAECRENAVARDLFGEKRANAIDACLSRASIQADMPGGPSYAKCRDQAISRNLSGEDLGRYIRKCEQGG